MRFDDDHEEIQQRRKRSRSKKQRDLPDTDFSEIDDDSPSSLDRRNFKRRKQDLSLREQIDEYTWDGGD
jgi:hypothetical protein